MVFGVATALAIVWTIGSMIALGVQCEPGSTELPHPITCDGTVRTLA